TTSALDPGLLDDAVEAVARVAEAGDDVAALVEPLVDRGGDDRDRDVDAAERGLEVGDALRGRQQADRGDVVGAAVGEEADGGGQGAAGGEHRVEHVALPPGQVTRQ